MRFALGQGSWPSARGYRAARSPGADGWKGGAGVADLVAGGQRMGRMTRRPPGAGEAGAEG